MIPEINGNDFQIPPLLRNLTSVVAVIIDDTGIVQQANQGFLFITGQSEVPTFSACWDVRSLFVQPSFNELKQLIAHEDGKPVYQGKLNIGDISKQCRTIDGAMYRSRNHLLIVGEHSIADLEKLSSSIVELNEELSATQRELVKTNRKLQSKEKKLIHLMQTDALTNISNRRHFETLCQQEINRSLRYQVPFCLAMADIDKFKQVNDNYGHGVGDTVIQSLARLLQQETRESDHPARIGGEEFVLLMPQTQAEAALNIIDRLRVQFSNIEHHPITYSITASFGVTEILPGDSLVSLLQRVDCALYQAKDNGRNQTIVK